MCGLIFCEGELEETEFLFAFNTIAHRGPDQAIIHKDKHGIFGFHRLAIMDISEKGMQPFITDRLIVMCNGEIYNELYLKEVFSEYPYTSHSDCEVLLPLYLEYGSKMGPYLDAECAFVIYDKELDVRNFHKKIETSYTLLL